MKTSYTTVLTAGVAVLIVSVSMLFTLIYMLPGMVEEYYNPVFRSSSFETDWLFYAHPFVLSLALYWFWEQYKTKFSGSVVMKAVQVALNYGAVAMLPVLWLTFSAVSISVIMVLTWLAYGIVQSFVAGVVFAKMSP